MSEIQQVQPQVETKVDEVREQVRKLALERGPGARLPTVSELCQLFSISRVTLREVVRSLIEENVLYSKRREGIFVSPKLFAKNICVLFDATLFAQRGVSPFWSNLWVRITQELQRRMTYKDETGSMHWVIPRANGEQPLPDEVLSAIRSRRLHGIISIGVDTPRELLASNGVACVAFATRIGGNEIGIDTESMVAAATRVLLQQGCRKIGLWINMYGGDQFSYEDTSMYQIMRQVHEEFGVPVYPEMARMMHRPFVASLSNYLLTLQEQGFLLANEIFGSPIVPHPDGLIITDDMMTDGALAALQKLGVKVGTDVKVATHANAGSPMLFARSEPMTVFEFDTVEVAYTMFSLLDSMMAGQELPQVPVQIGFKQRTQSGVFFLH